MNDRELDRIRRRKFAKLSRSLLRKEEKDEEKKESKEDLLGKVFVGRAFEVFNATKTQYPKVAMRLEEILTKLISSGKLKRVTGEELYSLLTKMGLRIRLQTKIRIMEHGELKSIGDKLKE